MLGQAVLFSATRAGILGPPDAGLYRATLCTVVDWLFEPATPAKTLLRERVISTASRSQAAPS